MLNRNKPKLPKQPKPPKQPKAQKKPKQPKPPKVPYTFADFRNELQSVKFDELHTWSPQFKNLSLFAVFIGTGLLASGFLIYPLYGHQQDLVSERTILLGDYKVEKTELVKAQYYGQQEKQLNVLFNQVVSQLPKSTELPALIDDLSLSARSSGLKVQDIKLDKESIESVFIRQPIKIEATGDFHDFGKMVDAVSKMTRIVTIDGFKASVGNQSVNFAGVPLISYEMSANTYRYKDKSSETGQKVAP